jgi:hypothetical protein
MLKTISHLGVEHVFDGDSKANAGKPGGKALKHSMLESRFIPVGIDAGE